MCTPTLLEETPAPGEAFAAPEEPADRTTPAVMNVESMSKNEKEKVRRLCTVALPRNTRATWMSRRTLRSFGIPTVERRSSLTCGPKAGESRQAEHGLHDPRQAIFLQRVEIISVSNKRKKIEVTGGFYSEEDMRTELGYKEPFGSIK